MKILAVDFSSARRSVAAADLSAGPDAAVLACSHEEWGRFTRSIGLVEDVLAGAGWEREQIEGLAVGLGPGSYHGIRAALALAQGWELARPVKTLGLGGIACLAWEAQAAGLSGRVNLVIDAQRQEFYLAVYDINGRYIRETEPLRLASGAEIRARLDAGETVAGPEVKGCFGAGVPLFPQAGTLARMACGRTDFTEAARLEPVYLRETNFVKAPPPRFAV